MSPVKLLAKLQVPLAVVLLVLAPWAFWQQIELSLCVAILSKEPRQGQLIGIEI
jgi:hypothetical protein